MSDSVGYKFESYLQLCVGITFVEIFGLFSLKTNLCVWFMELIYKLVVANLLQLDIEGIFRWLSNKKIQLLYTLKKDLSN